MSGGRKLQLLQRVRSALRPAASRFLEQPLPASLARLGAARPGRRPGKLAPSTVARKLAAVRAFLRHALGAASFEMNVDLILMDGGVLLAKKGQDDTGTGFTNLEGALKDCVDMGASVYADLASLKSQGVPSNEVVENVKLVGAKEIAGLLKEAQSTMIF